MLAAIGGLALPDIKPHGAGLLLALPDEGAIGHDVLKLGAQFADVFGVAGGGGGSHG